MVMHIDVGLNPTWAIIVFLFNLPSLRHHGVSNINVRAHLSSLSTVLSKCMHTCHPHYHCQCACSLIIINIMLLLRHYYHYQHACSPTLTISEPVAVAVCFNIYLCFRHLFQTSCHGQKLKIPCRIEKLWCHSHLTF